jgi:hypothetical protein
MIDFDRRTDLCVFTASDLAAAINVVVPSCSPPAEGHSAMDTVVRQLSHMLRAECACIYESNHRLSGAMTELYRHRWRDWQTDALSECLSGRPKSSITQTCIRMLWRPPGNNAEALPHWNCLASCAPAGPNYFLTVSFARRVQPFSEREAALLRCIHDSGIFSLITGHRLDVQPDASSSRTRAR